MRALVGYGPDFLSAARRLPYFSATQIRSLGYFAGQQIHPDRLNEVDRKIRAVSRQHVAECLKRGSWEDAIPSTIVPMENTSITGQLIAWRSINPFAPVIAQDGRIRLLNSDKLDTFVHAAAVLNIPNSKSKKTLVIDEGCDNGDILGFAIPWLSQQNRSVGVVLTNGNENKLTVASKLANWLLGKENSPEQGATSVLHNSFRDLVDLDVDEPDIQKLFLLYHLGIVERPQIISNMVSRRIEVMGKHDIGLITMLCLDEKSAARFQSRPGYETYETGFEGTTTIRRKVRPKTAKVLDALGADKDDYFNYLTAMTSDAACQIIRSAGGAIVHGSTITTMTEEGTTVRVMGLVFKGDASLSY